MEPMNDLEKSNNPDAANTGSEPKSSTASTSTVPKKEDKKRDDENEKKKQSLMAHWKYRPGPNASMASLYIYNNMTLGNNVPPPTLNNQSNNNISLPLSNNQISHPNNSSGSPSSTLSPKLAINTQLIEEPAPNSPEFKKTRRNSTPNMNNFITHWKFDPRAQQKQQRQQQLIGHHQQQMYMKRMSSLNLNVPSSPETEISHPQSMEYYQQQQLQQMQQQQQQQQRLAPQPYFHPYSSGRPRAPSIGNPPTSPRYDIYSSSPPSEVRIERRMSLPNVTYGPPQPLSPQYYYQPGPQSPQPPPQAQTPSPVQQQGNPQFISNVYPPSSPLSASSTPRNIYLDTIPEVVNHHHQYASGSSGNLEYNSVSGSPMMVSNSPSPPYSPVFCPTIKLSNQSPSQSSTCAPARRMSAPLIPMPYEDQSSSNTTTPVYRQAPPPFVPQMQLKHPNGDKSHTSQQQSQQNPPQQLQPIGENKLPSMRDLLNNLNIQEQHQQRERKEESEQLNNSNANSNKEENNSKMCIINLVQQ